MRPSPTKQRKSKKNAMTNGNMPVENSKIYQSGGSISLQSREVLSQWIEACNIRYFEHLALDPSYDESNLVLWEDEKGDFPVVTKDGQFDLTRMKHLKLEIYFHKEDKKYNKIISITFHLTGKRNSVVISGYAAHDWIDFELPVVKELIEMKKKGASYKKIFDKSNKEPFTSKLIVDPKNKGKLVTISLETKENAISNITSATPQEALSKLDNSLILEGSEGSASIDDDDISDDDISVQDKEDIPPLNLPSDTPLNNQRSEGRIKKEPIVDVKPLLVEIKHLKQENNVLLDIKNNLQCQVDNLTAKLLLQEESICLFESKLNTVHQVNGNLNIKTASNKERKLNPQTQNKSVDNATDPKPESLESQNSSHWINVCKDFNKGVCSRQHCKYEHKLVRMCRFYNKPTGCTKGKDCQFLHAKFRSQKPVKGTSGNDENAQRPRDLRIQSQLQLQQQQQQQRSEMKLNSFLEGLSKNIDKLLHVSASQTVSTVPYHTVTPAAWQPQLVQEQPTQPQYFTQNTTQTSAPWQQWQHQPFITPMQGQQIQPHLQPQPATYPIAT